MKINFSAGPAALPQVALERSRADLIDFEGTGMSVVEQSHRGAAYEKVQLRTIELLKELLAIPDTHEVVLAQGGARTQFAMVPLNLVPPGGFAEYAVTGYWAKAAADEAKHVCEVRICADTKAADGTYSAIPERLAVDANAAYVHLCSNNTIYGTQWQTFPDVPVPLVADMTSDLLSRRIEVSKFGVIYAGAQKNLGPAGLVVVIIAKDLLERSRRDIPTIWRYSTHVQHASLYYTPPMFAVAMTRHVLEHAVAIGGISAIEAANREKARRLYAALDARPETYRIPAGANARSMMNVCFYLPTADLDARFISEAQKRGMVGLKGHRTVGGVRASIYTWVSLSDVDALVDLIGTFQS